MLAPRVGVEPTAFPLGGGRSILLSYRGGVEMGMNRAVASTVNARVLCGAR